jgi:hypothetical protein
MPVLALLLALLVFVPDIAVAGSWASPAPVANVGSPSEQTAFEPAQLVRPAILGVPGVPHALLMVLFGTWLLSRWLPLAVIRWRSLELVPKPGRFGRAVLQAYLA